MMKRSIYKPKIRAKNRGSRFEFEIQNLNVKGIVERWGLLEELLNVGNFLGFAGFVEFFFAVCVFLCCRE